MKVRNIFGSRFSGTLGKDVVASSWKGKEYLRAYVVPRDPKTVLQLHHRKIWREAVAAWHALPDNDRTAWDREAEGMTGFNLFVSRYVRARRAGKALKPPKVPRPRPAPRRAPITPRA